MRLKYEPASEPLHVSGIRDYSGIISPQIWRPRRSKRVCELLPSFSSFGYKSGYGYEGGALRYCRP